MLHFFCNLHKYYRLFFYKIQLDLHFFKNKIIIIINKKKNKNIKFQDLLTNFKKIHLNILLQYVIKSFPLHIFNNLEQSKLIKNALIINQTIV